MSSVSMVSYTEPAPPKKISSIYVLFFFLTTTIEHYCGGEGCHLHSKMTNEIAKILY
jgi:hypothetical protein